MDSVGRTVQALILSATVLGVGLLFEIQPLVPAAVFDTVSVGWVLFVLDSVLTFVRPVPSYYLGLVLSVLGLSSSLTESAHWAFIQEGQLVPSTIFVAGSVIQVLIVVLVSYRTLAAVRRRGVTFGCL